LPPATVFEVGRYKSTGGEKEAGLNSPDFVEWDRIIFPLIPQSEVPDVKNLKTPAVVAEWVGKREPLNARGYTRNSPVTLLRCLGSPRDLDISSIKFGCNISGS
jgi:hypothetical protein